MEQPIWQVTRLEPEKLSSAQVPSFTDDMEGGRVLSLA